MTFGGGPYTRSSRFGFGFFGVVFRVGWGLGFRVVSFDFWGGPYTRSSRFGFGFFGVVFRVGWGLGFRVVSFDFWGARTINVRGLGLGSSAWFSGSGGV